MADNPQREHAGEYLAYLVRLWRENPEAPWRAMAKGIQKGDEHHFASLEQLCLFLHEQSAGRQE